MKRILVALALLLLVCVAGLLITAVDQIAGLAGRFHPLAGQVAFWVLVSGIAGAALFALFDTTDCRSRSPLPENASPDEHQRYLSVLRRRLKRNPKFKKQPLESIEEIQSALGALQIEADAIIRQTAATVFISTAAMENGRLDGIVLLLTQTRMIWQIARLYVQRPSGRDLIYLYGNVAGTALVANSLDNIDLSDVFAPVTASIAPAALSAIPGAAGISHFVVRCVSNGAANAFSPCASGKWRGVIAKRSRLRHARKFGSARRLRRFLI